MESKSCKVLVVEDEGLIALDISNRLTALGHELVGTASTAEEALEKASEADIVLMDIRIDGPVDGVDAAARIREKYHVPVVFLTAHSDRATLDRAKVTGAFGYLVKPIAHASLNTAIEIALYKHRMERKLEEREALLRTTLESVGDAIVVTDHLSRVLMLNAAAGKLTGWTPPEAEGSRVLRVLGFVDIEVRRARRGPRAAGDLKGRGDAPRPDMSGSFARQLPDQDRRLGGAGQGVGRRPGNSAHVSRRQRAAVGGKTAAAGAKSGRGGAYGGPGFRRIQHPAGEHPDPVRTVAEAIRRILAGTAIH